VWPLPLRIAFRFCFLYWLLYILPSAGAVSLFDLLPFGGIGNKLSAWFAWPLAQLAHVVGFYVFHLGGDGADWHPTGSGDTAMQYTLVFCIAVIAVVGTVAWSAIDERRHGRREYRTAYAWLRLALRVTLAITLLGYGFAKIFPGQFGLAPGLAELYGVWSVDSATGWPHAGVPQTITLDAPQYPEVQTQNGMQSWYRVQYDAAQHSIRFMGVEKGAQMRWDASVAGKAELRGDWMGVPVTLGMHRSDPETYLLNSRGFHWVQEHEFNR
jgi:hypothetical protein